MESLFNKIKTPIQVFFCEYCKNIILKIIYERLLLSKKFPYIPVDCDCALHVFSVSRRSKSQLLIKNKRIFLKEK